MAHRCNAFPGRFPSEIAQEERRLPVGMLDEILEARAFMEAKGIYDRLSDYDEKTRMKLMRDPLMQLVREIDLAIAAEEIKKRRGEQGHDA